MEHPEVPRLRRLPRVRSHAMRGPLAMVALALATAVVLFYPIGIACYWRASHGGTLRIRSLIISLVLGALLMASPIVLLKIKNLRYFRQDI